MSAFARATLSTSDDRAKIDAIRAEMPAVRRTVYLNAGTNGPLPRRSVDALRAHAQSELDDGRITMAVYERNSATKADIRAAMAALLGCDPLEIALTHNTTEGMNIALMGLAWQPGDEVVVARVEHEGGLNPAALAGHRHGATVRLTDIGMCDCDPVEELRKVLTPRTRAVVVSHVSWSTGVVLPLRAIADLAHSVGALVICDAAQACGMLPSPVYDLGVDAYACSGQKWLCGPDGTGALFVRQDRLDEIKPAYSGYGKLRQRMSTPEAVFGLVDGAVRYEVASFYPPALTAFQASLDWIARELGWEWVFRRIQELAHYCYDALAAVDGCQLYLPKEQIAGLIHFTVDGIAPADLTSKLAEQGINIRHTPEPELNRVATGFYNSEDDIHRLVEAIRAVQRAL